MASPERPPPDPEATLPDTEEPPKTPASETPVQSSALPASSPAQVTQTVRETSSGRVPPSVRWIQLQSQWRKAQLDSFERRQEIENKLQRFRVHVTAAQAVGRFKTGLDAIAKQNAELASKPDVKVPFRSDDDTGTRFGISLDSLSKLNERKDLNDLVDWGGVEGVAEKLRTSVKEGIKEDEPMLEGRRDVFGPNTYPEKPPIPVWRYFWEASKDPLLRILAVCAVLITIVGMVSEGPSTGWYDGVGIFFALGLVIVITGLNDWNQGRQFRSLDRKKKNIPIQVTREGRRLEISIYDIVVGDLVHLNLGDQVPADGILIMGVTLVCDESSMTGESRPEHKSVDRKPFLISGTKVVEGYGDMLVTAVGLNTEWGKIMSTISEESHEQTPLQRRLAVTALGIGKVGVVVAVIVFLALLIRYLVTVDYSQWKTSNLINFVDFFAQALTVVVVAIPEGLPLAVTLALAFSLRKMMNDNALVRHLRACEVMGGATTICSDKTGTLTTNKMTVVRSWLGDTIHDVVPNMTVLSEYYLQDIKEAIFLNTNGAVDKDKVTGEVQITGKPTETAVLGYGVELGGSIEEERARVKTVLVEPFNSARKRMGVLIQRDNGKYIVHWKGASEVLLELCNRYALADGSVSPLMEEKKAELRALIDDFADNSLRALCVAYTDYENAAADLAADKARHENGDGDAEEGLKLPDQGLVCLAIVGIKDPCRPGVPEAVQRCQSAGIKVRMVTGDYIKTARAIAKECNILSEGGLAMEGPEFRSLSHAQQLRVVVDLQVLARSSPTDKQILVKRLRELGNVVAVTGDGTNDAPALHQADIGLSMGISGTEIAKESSDIIVLDDNFATVVPIVRWGRSIFENIRKFVQFQLIVNIVALTLNTVTAIAYGVVTLTVVQLLWVNLIMDTMGALALATEKPIEKYMLRKPYGRTESLISNVMWRNMLLGAAYQLVLLLCMQFLGYKWFAHTWNDPDFPFEAPPRTFVTSDGQVDELNPVDWINEWPPTRTLYTIIFNTFVLLQVFNEFNSRDMEEIDVFSNVWRNPYFCSVIIITGLLQFVIVQYLNKFASTTALDGLQWAWCVGLGATMLPAAALIKLIPVPYSPTLAEYLFAKYPLLRRIFLGKKSTEELLAEDDAEAGKAPINDDDEDEVKPDVADSSTADPALSDDSVAKPDVLEGSPVLEPTKTG